ncbi:MAG TPA: hypothetical protein VGI61_09415 [Parafilimonas sp.]|jgi:hypothetical protein
MIQVSKQMQNHVKQLQRKRDTANQAFLDALTYVRPFEEVKKLFFDLKAIEAELNSLKEKEEFNGTA